MRDPISAFSAHAIFCRYNKIAMLSWLAADLEEANGKFCESAPPPEFRDLHIRTRPKKSATYTKR